MGRKPGGDVDRISFWTDGWVKGNKSFHVAKVNGQMMKYEADWLSACPSHARILYPLCGKSVDMPYLADKGHAVVGVEGVKQAIIEFMEENSIILNESSPRGDFIPFANGRLEILLGDWFKFNYAIGGGMFSACLDRGSLVAIP